MYPLFLATTRLITQPFVVRQSALATVNKIKGMDKYLGRKSTDSNSSISEPKIKKRKLNMAEKVGVSTEDKIKEIKGDLFSCPKSESLAHCISADIRMGKGIAVHFKKMFRGVEELRKQDQKPGGLAILKRDERYIYYLVTKDNYWQKPTYNTLKQSLVSMENHAVSHGVTDISMPMIGCGLDNLQWPKVLKIIRDIFEKTDINITVYHL